MLPIDQVRAKLSRALEHKQAWEALFDEWTAKGPWTIAGGPDESDPEWYVLRLVETLEPPHLSMSLIFADLIHNLRCVLDHLVWHLIDIRNGTQTSARGFPVVLRPEGWDGSVPNKLGPDVPPDAVEAIKAVQPFHADDPEAHWLHLLHQLDIRNKHHLIVRHAVTSFEYEPTFLFSRMCTGTELVESKWPSKNPIFENGSELVRVRALSESDDLRIVELLRVENCVVAIGPASDLFKGIGMLPRFDEEITSVIDTLEPFLSRPQPREGGRPGLPLTKET